MRINSTTHEPLFEVKFCREDCFSNSWHFHDHYELTYITKGKGCRYIGDHKYEYGPGDTVLIGPNLPHFYTEENDPSRDQHISSHAIIVHFTEKAIGEHILRMKESHKLKKLLSMSENGLQLKNSSERRILGQQLQRMQIAKGLEKWIIFINLLNQLSVSDALEGLGTAEKPAANLHDSHRLNRIIEFVRTNYQRNISVSDVARQLNMADNYFSKYFSQKTHQSFVNFLNEVRLTHARKLLLEEELNISEICYASGFNNLSNFNKQFKNLYNMNPQSYRKKFQTLIQ